jgi:hypothetical protein
MFGSGVRMLGTKIITVPPLTEVLGYLVGTPLAECFAVVLGTIVPGIAAAPIVTSALRV